MDLLVGLGNPGIRYARTRHNAGFLVLDELAGMERRRFSRTEAGARTLHLRLAGRDVILAKPQTYMNASGEAVAGLAGRYGLAPAQIMVIADDLDLPLGTLRFRTGGGAGGHRGIRSIIAALGGENFPRLRIGIGRPDGDAADYVLRPPSGGERTIFLETIRRAAQAVLVFYAEGPEAVMNLYNRRTERV